MRIVRPPSAMVRDGRKPCEKAMTLSTRREALSQKLRHLAGVVYLNPLMRWVPSLPARFRRAYASPRTAWPINPPKIPDSLRTCPGVQRVPEHEERAFREAPLKDFAQANAKAMLWLRGTMWRSMLPVAPRMWRARLAARSRNRLNSPVAPASAGSSAELTSLLKSTAASVGLSAIGIARYDERYTFDQWQGTECGDRMVVCILEQNYDSTQAIPSSKSEQTALSTYAELMQLACQLADVLHAHGYRAEVHDPLGRGVAIHYAVDAGLGQLGLNGQLLTPDAGSRCRIILVNTNAPLDFDRPADYGIPKLCDQCQICVRRCPPGAIPLNRADHRGVIKSKINTKRCFPVVAQAHGCAVCMKVCPIQRYGLQAVLDEYERSGKILGKGTDELEGFHWPVDGRHYGPGEKPRITHELMFPTGFELGVGGKGGSIDSPDTAKGRTWA
ncbi:hypothetical protein [Amycolatopsis benzoatilytica]|uniref:hypothetical protein n=1 Tax=Amycolatopsis benzoatilytica TaxID=346045 RepID=UPI00146CFC07|nr:hypothetical protein [Amycolatopsis benzoatilytica]